MLRQLLRLARHLVIHRQRQLEVARYHRLQKQLLHGLVDPRPGHRPARLLALVVIPVTGVRQKPRVRAARVSAFLDRRPIGLGTP